MSALDGEVRVNCHVQVSLPLITDREPKRRNWGRSRVWALNAGRAPGPAPPGEMPLDGQ